MLTEEQNAGNAEMDLECFPDIQQNITASNRGLKFGYLVLTQEFALLGREQAFSTRVT